MNKYRRKILTVSVVILFIGILFVLTNSSPKSITNVRADISNDNLIHFTDPFKLVATEQESDICSFAEPVCDDPSKVEGSDQNSSSIYTNENADMVIILFWMQGCEHCEEVINSLLSEIDKTYGNQIYLHQIELKDVEEVDRFYRMAERLGVTKIDIGVPLILVGNQVLTGDNIKNNLSGWIDKFLDEKLTAILMIPEFSKQLPESLQVKQSITAANVNQAPINNADEQKNLYTPFLSVGLVGIVLLVVVVIFKKKKSMSV